MIKHKKWGNKRNWKPGSNNNPIYGRSGPLLLTA